MPAYSTEVECPRCGIMIDVDYAIEPWTDKNMDDLEIENFGLKEVLSATMKQLGQLKRYCNELERELYETKRNNPTST